MPGTVVGASDIVGYVAGGVCVQRMSSVVMGLKERDNGPF